MLERQTRVLLRWWGRVLGRHSGLVLLVCLALTLGSATFLPRIQVQTEVTNLLPTDLPEVKAFLETQEVFGGDMTVCVVRAPGGTQVLDAQELIDLVVERFQALETVGQVQYNLLEGMPYKALIRHLPALLSPEEIPEFVARLAPDQIRARLLEDRSLLATTPDATVTELIREDPLALLLLLQDRFQRELARLEEWERTQMLSTLQRLAGMMDAEALDAAPMLETGAIAPARTHSAEGDEPDSEPGKRGAG